MRTDNRPQILVIEDEASLSRVLSLALKGGGFGVSIAATGAQGLQLIQEESCDLILSDIDLPDINGFEVCKRVKQNPKLRRIPIILMSGRLAEENQARAMEEGAVDFLSKPFSMKLLLNKIAAHVHSGNDEA